MATSKETTFEKFLIKEYLRFGSINKVFQKHHYSLPISLSGFDRLLNKYHVIKSAGPNSKFSESLYLISLLANYKIPLEKLYHQHAPHSLQVSTNTLHRILHFTRLGLTRRQGAILIITPPNDPHSILVGSDQSLGSSSIMGKRGDLTLPMGHTKVGEPIRDSLARILQSEVFSKSIVSQKFPWGIIPEHILPFVNINLTDIKVSVYHLELPQKYPQFSSYKLKNLKLTNINDFDFKKFRPGIKEAIEIYLQKDRYLDQGIPTINSDLNTMIFALARDQARMK